MPIQMTGLESLDDAHWDLQVCIRELGAAARERDAKSVRGRACLLGEMFAEHFTDEERLMRGCGWSQLEHHARCHAQFLERLRRFERDVFDRGVTHAHASWALTHLPELLRVHVITSDFGFGKYALGLARDPGHRDGRRVRFSARSRRPPAPG